MDTNNTVHRKDKQNCAAYRLNMNIDMDGNFTLYFSSHHCPTAMVELPGLRFSHLNIAYSETVLNIWREQGCFNEV